MAVGTIIQNVNKPAPRWFRVARKVWSNTENLVIAIWMIYDPAESPALLVFKLVSSFVKDQLDLFMVSQTEDYAPKAE